MVALGAGWDLEPGDLAPLYAGVATSFRRELVAGTQRACTKTAATGREVLALEPAVWTFVRLPGLEPTNNAVERALRHPVQGRKTS